MKCRTDSYFHVVYPYHPNDAVKLETHQTRQRSFFFQSSLVKCFEPEQIVILVSSSCLTGATPGVTSFWCSLFTSKFDALCVQRCSSLYIQCKVEVFGLSTEVWPFTSDLSHQGISAIIAVHWYFLFSENSLETLDIFVRRNFHDQHFLKYSDP